MRSVSAAPPRLLWPPDRWPAADHGRLCALELNGLSILTQTKVDGECRRLSFQCFATAGPWRRPCTQSKKNPICCWFLPIASEFGTRPGARSLRLRLCGIAFHASPGYVSRRLESALHQRGTFRFLSFPCLDSGPRTRTDLRLDRDIHYRDWLLFPLEDGNNPRFRNSPRADELDALDGWGAAPVVRQHYSLALANSAAALRGHGADWLSDFFSDDPPSQIGRPAAAPRHLD